MSWPTTSRTRACQARRVSFKGSNSCRRLSQSLDAAGSSPRKLALPPPRLRPPGVSKPLSARTPGAPAAIPATPPVLVPAGAELPAPAARLAPTGRLALAGGNAPAPSSSSAAAAKAASFSARSPRHSSPKSSSIVVFHKRTSCADVVDFGSPRATTGLVPEDFLHFCQSLKPTRSGAATEPSARTSASVLSVCDTCLQPERSEAILRTINTRVSSPTSRSSPQLRSPRLQPAAGRVMGTADGLPFH